MLTAPPQFMPTGTVLAMTRPTKRRPERDPFVDHLDQEWPLSKSTPGKEKPVRARIRAEMDSCPAVPNGAETAVTRWLQMGKRVIPDGPRVEQFIVHRLEVCRHNAELGILPTADTYDEYVAMCDLGGWQPVGKKTFFAKIEGAGYPRIRARMPNGDRYWLYNFTIPPTD